MENLTLKPGDIFCSASIGSGSGWLGNMLGYGIKKVSKLKSLDNQAEYTHSGIIMSSYDPIREYEKTGYEVATSPIMRPSNYTYRLIDPKINVTTFEARGKYGFYNMDDYTGKRVLIGRLKNLDNTRFLKIISEIYNSYNGRRYPFWRLLMFLMPLATNVNLLNMPVCSELVSMILMKSNDVAREQIGTWKGKTPDMIADMVNKWDIFDVIYEGFWE